MKGNGSALEQLLCQPLSELAQASRTRPFDVVVVGGGTAGIVAAVTMAERGRSVALLEAGPVALLTHVDSTDLRFQPEAARWLREALGYEPKHGPSGEGFGLMIGCLGGRGQFWNGAAPRMQAHELVDWPLGLEELEAHYPWAESRLGVSGDYGQSGLADALFRHLGRAGFPFISLPWAIDTHPTAAGWLGGTIGNGVSILLREGRFTGTEPNPRLATNAFAARILLSADGQARGVAAIDRSGSGGAGHEIEARSVVLAAGAFESVRLAKVSELPDRSGQIGRRLFDHAYVRAYVHLPAGWYDPVRSEVALGLWPSSADRPFQVELHAPMGRLFGAREGAEWAPGADPDYRVRLRAFAPVEAGPEARIEVEATDEPGSYVVHLEHGPEARTMAEQAATAIHEIAAALDPVEEEFEVMPPGGSYHEAGGLGMGTSAAESVTDQRGRIWSCQNVAVCDASVWPSIGAANPHLSIAAISRRNALLMAEEPA